MEAEAEVEVEAEVVAYNEIRLAKNVYIKKSLNSRGEP